MALSDCPKCWDTPCTCGHYWRDYSLEAKKKQVEAIMGEKMYSRDEVRQAILDYGYTVTGEGDIERNLDKWIKENL
jgi:hypothetical protein